MTSTPTRHLPVTPLELYSSGHSAMPCRYRCGDACFKAVPNASSNEYFGDVVAGLSRRSMLQAGGVGAVALGLRPDSFHSR